MKFTVGMKVYSKHYRSAHFTVHTVTKVHKNGNFVIDGGKQQYRQDGGKCGSGGYSLLGVQPLTDEKHAELIAGKGAQERATAFRDAVRKLDHLNWATTFSEDQLERIQLLVAELVKPKAPE